MRPNCASSRALVLALALLTPSVSAIDFLIRTYGQDALGGLIRSYADGVSDDLAFEDALGVNVAGFEAAWLADLGIEVQLMAAVRDDVEDDVAVDERRHEGVADEVERAARPGEGQVREVRALLLPLVDHLAIGPVAHQRRGALALAGLEGRHV